MMPGGVAGPGGPCGGGGCTLMARRGSAGAGRGGGSVRGAPGQRGSPGPTLSSWRVCEPAPYTREAGSTEIEEKGKSPRFAHPGGWLRRHGRCGLTPGARNTVGWVGLGVHPTYRRTPESGWKRGKIFMSLVSSIITYLSYASYSSYSHSRIQFAIEGAGSRPVSLEPRASRITESAVRGCWYEPGL